MSWQENLAEACGDSGVYSEVPSLEESNTVWCETDLGEDGVSKLKLEEKNGRLHAEVTTYPYRETGAQPVLVRGKLTDINASNINIGRKGREIYVSSSKGRLSMRLSKSRAPHQNSGFSTESFEGEAEKPSGLTYRGGYIHRSAGGD